MRGIKIRNIRIELTQGDVTRQNDMEAIANAANAWLRGGGGVAGAIHRAAGPELEKECAPLAPIKPGNAVITSSCKLPNAYIIHCLGPVYGIDTPSDQILASCYKNAIRLCEKHQINSIAFPAISTGVFGYPIKEAAWVSLQAISEVAKEINHPLVVRMVLFSENDLAIYQQALKHFGQPE